jgi:hypothetical protein
MRIYKNQLDKENKLLNEFERFLGKIRERKRRDVY